MVTRSSPLSCGLMWTGRRSGVMIGAGPCWSHLVNSYAGGVAMRVLVLGPVELRAEDRAVALGGPKPSTLLVALLCQPRSVVSIEQLITYLWDDNPPRSATALIHTYVSALRRAFAAAG